MLPLLRPEAGFRRPGRSIVIRAPTRLARAGCGKNRLRRVRRGRRRLPASRLPCPRHRRLSDLGDRRQALPRREVAGRARRALWPRGRECQRVGVRLGWLLAFPTRREAKHAARDYLFCDLHAALSAHLSVGRSGPVRPSVRRSLEQSKRACHLLSKARGHSGGWSGGPRVGGCSERSSSVTRRK